ncbi:MAG: hydroxymethylbilane synthase [Propionibacterium sp.]|nr:hydroxymethylbilane synthase [Propionibacterium sp.]
MKLGTRASTLALTQSSWVADMLRSHGHEVEIVTIRTRGDHERGSLTTVSGLGVFAAELRSALLRGEVDLAVHSLKDLPVETVPGLLIAAIPDRESPYDALCSRDGLTLEALPAGARVGTGSPRRVAQLRALRPDLVFVDIRGNIDTRLARVAPGDLDAVVLAAAGLRRLGLAGRITEELSILPAPGQGALAVECRADDDSLIAALEVLDDAGTRLAVAEERAVLAALGGGCAAPIASLGATGKLLAGVYSADGACDARTEVPLTAGAGERAATRLLEAGAASVTQLNASRASRLAEFHDDADLWPGVRGRKIFLPREPGALSEALASCGLEVTAFPVQTPVALVNEVDLGQAAWSVVTSARTVEILQRLGARLPGRIAAVGKATAAALESAGYAVDLIPAQASGMGLVEEFPEGPGKVVIPGSALSKQDLPDGLQRLGWEVGVFPVYTMKAAEVPTGLVAAWRAGEFSAVVVTAGSVARVIDEHMGWPEQTRVLAIGQPTARVLNELGVAASVSPAPDADTVARAAVELVGKGNA